MSLSHYNFPPNSPPRSPHLPLEHSCVHAGARPGPQLLPGYRQGIAGVLARPAARAHLQADEQEVWTLDGGGGGVGGGTPAIWPGMNMTCGVHGRRAEEGQEGGERRGEEGEGGTASDLHAGTSARSLHTSTLLSIQHLSLILLPILTPSLQAVWTLERFIQTRVWEPALKAGAPAAQILCLV